MRFLRPGTEASAPPGGEGMFRILIPCSPANEKGPELSLRAFL